MLINRYWSWLSEFERATHGVTDVKGSKVLCCAAVVMSTFKGNATVGTWVGVSKSHIEQHGILDGGWALEDLRIF